MVTSAAVVGIGLSLTDLQNNYADFTISNELQGDLDNFSTTLTEIQDKNLEIQNRTSGVQASQEVDSGLDPKQAISAIKLSWESFGILQTMMETFADNLNINSIWLWTASGVLVITITFIIASAILKNPL